MVNFTTLKEINRYYNIDIPDKDYHIKFFRKEKQLVSLFNNKIRSSNLDDIIPLYVAIYYHKKCGNFHLALKYYIKAINENNKLSSYCRLAEFLRRSLKNELLSFKYFFIGVKNKCLACLYTLSIIFKKQNNIDYFIKYSNYCCSLKISDSILSVIMFHLLRSNVNKAMFYISQYY